jgi:hypothetical protein
LLGIAALLDEMRREQAAEIGLGCIPYSPAKPSFISVRALSAPLQQEGPVASEN